jgi:hypothetical protein
MLPGKLRLTLLLASPADSRLHQRHMPAPAAILDLVARFGEHIDAYKSGSYNETQLRRDFLDPMFKELGWDMDNVAGYAEAYRDVIHEDQVKVKVSGKLKIKAPDYGFRIGGNRKFFLEAKRPSVRIKDDISPAYQLRRYAWSAKLPLSILSDFEEFAVYDTRQKPKLSDPASKARIFYCRFDEYVQHWDHIASIFSREGVLKGGFDKYAATTKGKRGTTEVDADFLATIEGWRADLARNLALRNPALTQRELNFAVQRVLDRLIFLRICEDRGIEEYERLKKAADAKGIYPELIKLFQQADDRYNSGLFHFRSEKDRHEDHDTLTPHLLIDDALLKPLIRGLYYPDSPYEFSVLSADILGQVYEQFLGKIITLNASHKATVEDKPEVKKAGGVFYTPTYIVGYIVRQTVGTLIGQIEEHEIRLGAKRTERAQEKQQQTGLGAGIDVTDEKMPKRVIDRVAQIKVLDPACGSGSFLIGAYQFLLDWHLSWYVRTGVQRWAKGKNPPIVQRANGDWVLSLTERKRIMLGNLHGVDIDSQAVEVTKLSLLLKVLEVEGIQAQQTLGIHDRVLPDLGDNIKCGNSLIGSDFYAQPGLLEMDREAHLRINVFDWDGKDGFSEIMKAGGFDTVIGNPPYVRQESIKEAKGYLESHYEAYDGVADLYAYFMEKGVKLLRPGGLFSIIVSNSFLRTNFAAPLRRTLKKHAAVRRMVDFGGLAVFASAKDTYVCIPLLERGGKQGRVEVSRVPSLDLPDLSEHAAKNHYLIPGDRLSDEAWSLKSDEEAALFDKVMRQGKPLGKYVDGKMFYGLKTGLNEAFVIDQAASNVITEVDPVSDNFIHPLLGGQDIRRYEIRNKGQYLIVIPCGYTTQMMKAEGMPNPVEKDAWRWLKRTHYSIAAHLEIFADALRKRDDQGDFWWELRPCDYYRYFDAPKIIFPDICKGPRFFPDDSGNYIANTAYCLGTGDRYLLGFLNSRLFWFAIANLSIPFGVRAGQFRYRLIYQYMEKVPVRVIDSKNKADQAAHARIVALVEKILTLHAQRSAARTPHEQTVLDRQIGATDALIDREVYALYDLTPEEIALVEGSSEPQEENEVMPAAADPQSRSASHLDATLEYPHKHGYRGHMVFREDPAEYAITHKPANELDVQEEPTP